MLHIMQNRNAHQLAHHFNCYITAHAQTLRRGQRLMRGKYGEPFVSIDAHNRSIDAHIPVRMRTSSVFLNMRKIINKNLIITYIRYLVVIFLRWLATRLFVVLLLSSPSESP